MIHIINKIKSSKTSYLFILFIVVLISCNAPENMIDEANYKSNIKIDNVEVSELFKRKEFNDIVTKLYKQKNGNEFSRTVMENQYGFTILDQLAKVIEQNNKITYTLAISRDNQAGSSMGFENLIISSDSLNQPQAVIVKYRPFVPMNQLLTNNGGFEGEVKVTPITYNNTQVTGKIASDCFEIILSKCTGIPYDCGGEVCGFKRYIICPSAGGDSGETAGTTIGGGSTSGSSNPPGGGSSTTTTPNGGGGNSNHTSQNPCVTIKKLKKDFVFKTKLASLFQSAKIDNFEKYSVLSADPTPNVQEGQEDAYDYADAQGAPNTAGATYTAYTNSLGVIHSHYAGLNSIFSPDDLQDLYNKMLVPEIVDDFFIGVVTAEGTAYILQVTDRQAFINFGNKYLANDTKTRDFLEKIYKGKYNLNSDDKVENEKNFLNMMSDLGMGTSLAGTNFSSTAQPTPNLFSNLQVKTLNEMTQNVQNTNCN